MTGLRLALLSVLRRRLTLLLVVLPTSVLFTLLTVLIATLATMRQLLAPGVDAQSIRVGAVEGVSLDRAWFTMADIDRLSKIPGIQVTPANFNACYVDASEPFAFACYIGERTYITIWDNEFHASPEQLDAWDAVPNGALITRALSNKYHWKIGDHITVHQSVPQGQPPLDFNLVVTGISDVYRKPTIVWMHAKYHREVNEQVNHAGEKYWVIWILVDKPERRAEVMQQVDAVLDTHPHVLWKLEQAKQFIAGTSAVVRTVFLGAGILSGLLVLCLAVTLLILSIEQRATEFATLRAVGFRAGVLARSTLLEGALLLLPGAVLGAVAVYWRFHSAPIIFGQLFQVDVTAAELALGIAAGPVLGFISAIIPAWRVFRLDVLTSLR